MRSSIRRTALLAAAMLSFAATLTFAADGPVTLTREQGKIVVRYDDKPFTELRYTGHAKPILWPLVGPTGAMVERAWPVDPGAGGPHDHPHHEGLWFTHGSVNGVDFWSLAKNHGTIVQTKTLDVEGGPRGLIKTADDWIGPDGKLVLTDTRTLVFRGDSRSRILDFEITLTASRGDVTFGDTKEGTFGLRVNPALQLPNTPHVTGPGGQILSSTGLRNDAAWGKRADWIAYWAPIDGKVVGVAMFDHPSNLRHPCIWHARGYGLMAANPFGISEFLSHHKGHRGDYTLRSGQSLTLRYRVLLFEGDPASAHVADVYKQFAALPGIR